MKTLYLTEGCNILVDTENNSANKLNSAREAISRIYLIDEPMHIVYGSGEYHSEKDADKGDIVVTFYDNAFKNKMIIVKNQDWAENIIDYNKKMQEEKERWAQSKCCDNCDCCKCENC